MSKSITVPDTGFYPTEITINKTKYVLEPGTTVTVPDEVAALLDDIFALRPKADANAADLLPADRKFVKEKIAEAIAGGGGGGDTPGAGAFIIKADAAVEADQDDETIYNITLSNIDKTKAEVDAARAAGQPIWLDMTAQEQQMHVYMRLTRLANEYMFACVLQGESSNVTVGTINLEEDEDEFEGNGQFIVYDFSPELPAVSGSDNGKVLGVSSGAWATITAPSSAAFFEFDLAVDPILGGYVCTARTGSTYEAIKAAYDAHKIAVAACITEEEEEIRVIFCDYIKGSNDAPDEISANGLIQVSYGSSSQFMAVHLNVTSTNVVSADVKLLANAGA